MNKRTMVALVGSALLSSHAVANTDSVNDWGKWGQLFTAAGQPTVNIPLSFPQVDDRNILDASAFVTPVSEESSIRFYGAAGFSFPWSPYDQKKIKDITISETSNGFTYTDESDNTYAFEGWVSGYSHSEGEIAYSNLTLQCEHWGHISVAETDDRISAWGWGSPTNIDLNEKRMNQVFSITGGLTTSLDQLQRLASITKASYSGAMFRNHGLVNITVDFKNANWNGDFQTNESYFFLIHNISGVNSVHVEGGTINGANLTATTNQIQVVSNSALVKASISGSFFGDNASNIGGVVDVTTEAGRFVDVFDAAKDPSQPVTPNTFL